MTLSDRLRRETRAEHDAIEAALDWRRHAGSPALYRRWLERLYAFHRVWEPAVAAALPDPALFAPRRKLALLRADLVRLGARDAELAALPAPDPVLAISGEAEALGSLYVVEGSSLGGALIARHVEATLGFAPAYHAAYGRRAAAMWSAFRLRLDAAAVDPAAVVAAADATFRHLRRHLAPDATARP
jgi:heme oxygenase (biliverdin-IX-beta and delta-forming)